jgi:hypothetical protein
MALRHREETGMTNNGTPAVELSAAELETITFGTEDGAYEGDDSPQLGGLNPEA